jgi:CPA2 family monovalent cation:H+ antiporter-2
VAAGTWGDILMAATTLLLMAPFLWALAMHRLEKEAQGRIWANKNYRSLLIVLEFARLGVVILFIGFLLNQFFAIQVVIIVTIVIIALLAAFSNKIQALYIRIENRFLANLNAREIDDASKMHQSIVPWDAYLTKLKISPASTLVGNTLVDLQIRERYGVNVAVIERGDQTIMAPTRLERLFPGDRIYVFGTDEQIAVFQQFVEEAALPAANNGTEKENVGLQTLVVTANSPLLHKTIREAGIRETTKGLVVGVERKGERILNPDSGLAFEEGDILWIVGAPGRIKQLSEVTKN